MKTLNCIAGISLVAGACLLAPSAQAAWGSIHGNNEGRAIPERPSFGREFRGGRERGFEGEHRAPEVRGQEFRGRERGRDFGEHREFREPERRDWGRYREWEGDRFRGDFDDDLRGSYYWSRFHPGLFLNVLPPDYFSFSIGGAPYDYYQGVYYEPQAGGYVVVAPPIGAVVPALPPGAQAVMAASGMLYYANGTFYAPTGNGYQVIPAPLGVTVSMLPPDAAPVVINGMTYYQAYGVYYVPVIQDGVTAYETVQPPP